MANGEYDKKRNGDIRHPVLAVVLGALLGGGGSIGVFLSTPVGQEFARPDPFTGSQGAKLIQRVSHIEEDVLRRFNIADEQALRNLLDECKKESGVIKNP